MEEIAAVLGLVKEGASLLVMAWLVLRSGKSPHKEASGVHPHQIREDLLTELAELPSIAKALMHPPETTDGAARGLRGTVGRDVGPAVTGLNKPTAAAGPADRVAAVGNNR